MKIECLVAGGLLGFLIGLSYWLYLAIGRNASATILAMTGMLFVWCIIFIHFGCWDKNL